MTKKTERWDLRPWAQGPLSPITELEQDPGDDSDLTAYVTPSDAAGDIVWKLLTHSQEYGPDIARIARMTAPDDLDEDDVWGFFWGLLNEAGRIGYLVGKVEFSAFGRPHDGARIDATEAARAMAPIVRIDLVEDGGTFDPEYHAKREAAEAAA